MIGPLLSARETAVKPSVTSGADLKYRNLLQIWDQLILQSSILRMEIVLMKKGWGCISVSGFSFIKRCGTKRGT